MRLTSYKNFHKAIQRMRLLYEVTIHSYNSMYENGKQELRSVDANSKKIEFKLGEKSVFRPLRVIAYHARDVYPELFRSTLLVQIVAAYEAFLVDSIDEISKRSTKPFMTKERIDLPQDLLLSLAEDSGIIKYIVDKAMRQLTSGGLKDIRKFYIKKLDCDLVATDQSLSDIEEVHDRRHIYVHSSGYVDNQYCHKYPANSFQEGDKIPVNDEYLVNAIETLEKSALFVKKSLETNFPSTPIRSYIIGEVDLQTDLDNLVFISFKAKSNVTRKLFGDPDLEISKGNKLKNIVIWMSNDEEELRYILGGKDKELKAFRLMMREAKKNDEITNIESFKIKR